MKGKGHGEKQTRKQDLAILALLTEKTLKDAAEKAGIGEATLWRWMQQDSFKEKYQDAKRETVSHVTARLRHSMTIAVDALVSMAENPKTPAMARASAARTLLEYGFKAHEMEDLQGRVEQLEEQFKESEGNKSWG
jgi:DNA-binding MurR/RpiR family transcriptional regulator